MHTRWSLRSGGMPEAARMQKMKSGSSLLGSERQLVHTLALPGALLSQPMRHLRLHRQICPYTGLFSGGLQQDCSMGFFSRVPFLIVWVCFEWIVEC